MSESYSIKYLSHTSNTVTFQYTCPDNPAEKSEWWALYEGEVPEYKDLGKYAKWGWICPEKKGCESSGTKTVDVGYLSSGTTYSIALLKWKWDVVGYDKFTGSEQSTLEGQTRLLSDAQPTPSFNKMQQVFSLSMFSNIISNEIKWAKNQEKEFEEELAKKLNTILSNSKIQSMMGSWEIVWGPKVYQAYPTLEIPVIETSASVSDNVMYVAHRKDLTYNKNQEQYVVAISGTNPVSYYGWIVEDGTLAPPVSWPHNSNTGELKPTITTGTSDGLDILLNKMSDDNHQGKLTDFLNHVVTSSSNPVDICVTGHSLGGTLSIALGLALIDLQGDTWDKNNQAVVSVISSAGATAGDVDFAQYYDQRLGTRTNRIWNKIDMVPHAWQSDMLLNIPNLYYPHIVPNALTYTLSNLALCNSMSAGTLKHVNAQSPGLPGQVNLDLIYEIGLTQLELGLANLIIQQIGKKLQLPEIVIYLITKFIDHLIKEVNEKSNLNQKTNWEQIFAVDPAKIQEFQPLKHEELASQFEALPFEHKVLELATRTLNINGLVVNLLDEVKSLLVFLNQASWQHTTAYAHLAGIYPLYLAYQEIIANMDDKN